MKPVAGCKTIYVTTEMPSPLPPCLRLTAFVLKTFAQARTYIFIDEAHITQALIWLSQKQKDNGCFRSSGSLLNNAIKVKCPQTFGLSTMLCTRMRRGGNYVGTPQGRYQKKMKPGEHQERGHGI